MRQIAELPVFIGSVADLADPAQVCRQGIEAVVIVAPEQLPDPWPRDLTIVRVPLNDDGENAPAQLRRAVDIVAALIRDRTPTLLVCSAGLSRSVVVATGAIARDQGLAPVEALRIVSAGHACDVSPGLWNSFLQLPHNSTGNGS